MRAGGSIQVGKFREGEEGIHLKRVLSSLKKVPVGTVEKVFELDANYV